MFLKSKREPLATLHRPHLQSHHPLVSLRDVNKQFNGQSILEGIDIDLLPGQLLSLIGPSGCGKTTMVKIVLGLVKPNTGTVSYSPGLRIGYMPQKIDIDATLPLTVMRFLQLANPDLSACNAALNQTGVAHLANRPLQVLSGGETQRVLLARALLRQPNLLILDEPVQGVDITGQEALYQLISDLRDQLHCAILMVSHDLHLVMAATDEVVCLNRHICCHGSPQQVTNDPAFVELFGARQALYTHHHDHQHDSFDRNQTHKGGE